MSEGGCTVSDAPSKTGQDGMSVTEDQDIPRETFMEVHIMRSSSSGVTPPSKSVDEKDEIAVPAALRNVR